ncbi:AraC family transcriptional regulator [Paenibacillus glycanilyticus]|uniref:helix-turn-helix transcriptional regulator n=1 Tax=Paenibacillus glycanilyticus TaxID=126569 RepID=UPI00203D1CC9|nr:AraC family transcriptional regulator [Paenibacillus glycanilyticus]MCM3626051.1 AraC family transcriptional regulator [Paenibacillus glycanilyticus]
MGDYSRFISPAYLIASGEFDCDISNPFVHPLHRHETYSELLFIEEGRGTFVIDNQSHETGPGAILLYQRGVWHEEMSTHYPFRATYFAFKGLQLKGIPQDYFLSPEQRPVIELGEKGNEILKLVRECHAELHSDAAESNAASNHLFGLLLVRLARHVSGGFMERGSVKPSEAAVMKARSYIEENYRQPITLDLLAKVTFVSKYYLSHLFLQEVGMSTIQYLIRCRIEAAKRYLAMTRRPMKEIGELVGYQSETTFHNIFKKVTGHTPGQYRELNEDPQNSFLNN